MLFKTRELSQTIRPVDYKPQTDIKKAPPSLDINTNLPEILLSDINSNENLLGNIKDQFKHFLFEDLTYFSWSNFISSIRIFQYGSAKGIEVLAQIIKKELRFQLKELKVNKPSRDLYQTLITLFQRIFLLQRHLNGEINLSSIILPIINEELNNLQRFWEIFLQESYSSKIIESLHIFILMEDQSPQKTSEKVISLFKTRYLKVRDLFKSMDDFLLFF